MRFQEYSSLKRTSLWLMAVLFSTILWGQGEADHWAIGWNTIIDFSSGMPILSTNGGHDIKHGNSTISDPCGNLLFFTNGDSVWDQNYNPMVGGFGLLGDIFVGNQILIVPHPGNSDQFYIIYSAELPGVIAWNVYFALVDMSLQGGLGEVTQKVQFFHPGRTTFISGVQHANGIDTWVSIVDYPSDTLYSYLITTSGIQTNPVKSYPGPIFGNKIANTVHGQSKFSPNGQHFAISLYGDKLIKLMDFDPASGLFSNLKTLPVFNYVLPGVIGPAGIDFSPTSNHLYWCYWRGSGIINDSIYQADITSGNQATIVSSIQPIGYTNSWAGPLRMQLSNNGKIYCSRNGLIPPSNIYFDVINSPNLSGIAADFQNQAITVNGGEILAPPTFLAHFLRPWEVSIGSVDTLGTPPCVGDTLPFALSYYNQIDSILWDFGDGSGIVSALQTDHSYGNAGTFPVSAVVYRGCPNPDTLRDTVSILPIPLADVGPDTSLCEGLTLLLDAGSQPGVSFLWSDSSLAQTFVADTTGWVWLEAENACLVSRDSMFLTFDSLSVLDLGPVDTLLCPGQDVLLDASISHGTYHWQDGSSLSSFLADTTGLYFVTARNACDTLSDSLFVQYETLPSLDLGADTTLCEGTSLLLDGTFVGYGMTNYLWQNGSIGPTQTASYPLPANPYTYHLDLSNLCGTVTDSIQITYRLLPQVDLGADQIRCLQDSLVLTASYPDVQSYLWQDGSTDSVFWVNPNSPGSYTYSVSLSNACASAADTLNIDFINRPVADLGADTVLCDLASYLLDQTQTGSSYLWQDGSQQASYLIQSPGLYWVAISNAACTERDSLNISYQQSPQLDLGPADTLLCDNATLLLDASFPNGIYRWQDGSTSSSYTVTAPNTYSLDLSTFCGTVSDQIEVGYGQTPVIDLGPDTSLCEGEALLLDATFPEASYLWHHDGSTEATVLATEAITYTAEVSTLCGITDDHITIHFFPPPIVNLAAQADTIICEGSELNFDLSHLNASYLWPDGSTEPTYQTGEAGRIIVLVENGCTTTSDTLTVQLENCDCPIYAPTAFTPNNDGHNDVFRLGFDCTFLDYELQVFNRWGRRVFVSQDPAEAWDGTAGGQAQAEGVFTYVIAYRFRSERGESEGRKMGTITVWR
jgi:gliding motility-associated-like protein